MAESAKHTASRSKLRVKIIDAAIGLFEKNGIKSVTMDDIASSFGISKRTLYEMFADKETLLMECVRRGQEEMDNYLKEVRENSDNVLEVLLKGYQRNIEKFHATNKRFFEDIKRYPRAYNLIKNGDSRSAKDTVSFFRQGVKQGYFRDDIIAGARAAGRTDEYRPLQQIPLPGSVRIHYVYLPAWDFY